MPRVPKSQLSKEFTITLHETGGGFDGNRVILNRDIFGVPQPAQLNRFFIWPEKIKYFIGQLEKGEQSAHEHLQAYVEFDMEPMSIKAASIELMSLFVNKKAHIEVARGSRRQQITYVHKDDTRVNRDDDRILFEKAGTTDETAFKEEKKEKRGREAVSFLLYETLQAHAKAEDNGIVAVYDSIQELMRKLRQEEDDNEKKIIHSALLRLERQTTQFAAFAATFRQRIKPVNIVRRQIQVVVLYGPPGTGKTREVLKRYGKSIHKKMPYSRFWGGYVDQHCLLLDDFKGEVGTNAFLTPDQLQQICEGWDYEVDQKGKGPVKAKWKVVAITTNLQFNEWYNHWEHVQPIVKESIRSRIPESCWEEIGGIDHRPKIHKHYDFDNLEIVED